MATVGLYGSTASSTVASPSGSESVGLYGNNTVFGGSYFEWFIFQVSDTQPSTPTGGSWDFTTNTGTPPTGWLASPPVSPTNTVWVSIGLVNSKSTVAITWSVPGKFSFSSGLPILSGTATPLPGDGQTDQLYIQTSTTPETIWFKQAGTWTRLTGSTLYADLTSNQTLAGIKTFSSPIAGSVTGTSANVTGIVSITNGGTGTTSANSAFNALAPSQTGNSGKFLTTDGSNTSWSTNPLGTVTSVAVSGGTTGLTTSGGPITTSGTITLAGTLAVANGGTGVTTSTGTGSGVLNTGASLVSATVSDYETFTSVAAPTYTEGRLWYDSTQKALTYNSDISGNSLHVGQETQLKVRNGTGSTIAKGAPVYITSTATGVSFPNIALAKADTLTTGNCIGLTNEAIASGADGYVVINGILNGVNTGTFTVGDVLYVSPYSAGQLMNTFPPTGYPVKIGVVSFVNSSTGSIYINQSNAFVQASSVIGTLAIANGGTGATTANAAFNALAPAQTGNSGKYLTTNGTDTSWATNPLGTVTSVGGTGTVNGLTLTGTVTTSGNLTLGGTLDLSSPPAIGATAANTGAFTTLSASSTVTLSGGTANGVAYLNGSKVLTTGTALTFDGTNFGVNSSSTIDGGRFSVAFAGNTQNGIGLKDTADASGASFWGAYNSTGGFIGSLRRSGTDNALAINGNSYLAFQQNSTEQMRLTSTGLGIGTSSPGNKLDIQNIYATAWTPNTSVAQVNIQNNSQTANSTSLIQSAILNADSTFAGVKFGAVAATNYSADFVIANRNVGTYQENLRLTASGNLGIGTTSPATKLDIAGTKTLASDLGVANIRDTASYATGNGGAIVLMGKYNSGGSYVGGAYLNASKENATDGNYSYALTFGTNVNGGAMTERMRLDSAGNLGINTTTPQAKFDVNGVSFLRGTASGFGTWFDSVNTGPYGSYQYMTFDLGSTQGAFRTFAKYDTSGSGSLNIAVATTGNSYGTNPSGLTYSTLTTLTSAGNFGIGTSSPTVKLDVSSTGSNVATLNSTAANGAYLAFAASGTAKYWIGSAAALTSGSVNDLCIRYDANMVFSYQGVERARIDSSGNLLVGTTSLYGRLTISSTGTRTAGFIQTDNTDRTSLYIKNVYAQGAQSATMAQFINSADAEVGSIKSTTTATLYNTTSDYRLKTVIGAVSGAGERIDALEPIEYTWKADGSHTRGFLAHKFQEVYAGSVSGEKDAVDAKGNPVYQAMQASSSEVIADLVAEIQSLRQRLAALETK